MKYKLLMIILMMFYSLYSDIITSFSLNNSIDIIDNKIFFMQAIPKGDPSHNRLLVNGYFMIDSSHYHIDASYITQVNVNEKITKYIYFDKNINYQDFLLINKDIIISVGNNNMISVSENGGKSFEFKSFFTGFMMDLIIFIN